MAKKILVVGASGAVGAGIVRELREQGVTVRTSTSKRNTSGADNVYLDLTTGEGVQQAFTGIERAFLMSPGGYADQYAMLAPLVQAAKEHRLEKVVLMTAFGADADPASPMRRAELELEQSGLAYNIIRPNWFMQNFNSFWLHGIQTENTIALPVGDATTSFIDVRDISAVAATLLQGDEWSKGAFNLTGPESITHAQAAKAIAEASGRPVVYRDAAPAELKAGLLGAGLPEPYVDFLLLILGYLKAGYNAAVTDDVKTILGRAPGGFQQYVQDYRGAWS